MPAFYWMFAIAAGIIPLASYVVAFVIAIRSRRHAPRAAQLLLWALGIWLAWRLISIPIPLVATRFVTPTGMATVSAVLALVGAILNVVSLSFIVRAVFIDRDQQPTADADVFLRGDGTDSLADANPFRTPGSD